MNEPIGRQGIAIVCSYQGSFGVLEPIARQCITIFDPSKDPSAS